MTWLANLLARYRNRHDPAFKPTGIRYVFTGHDEAKGAQAFQKAQRQTASGRTYRRSKPKVAAKVLPMKVAK